MLSLRAIVVAFSLLIIASLYDLVEAGPRAEVCRTVASDPCYRAVDRRARRPGPRRNEYRVTRITDDRVHPADYGPFYPTRRYYYRYPYYASPFVFGFWWW